MISALAICWQDFRERQIHIIWMGLMAISGGLYRYVTEGLAFLPDIWANTLIIALMVLLILIWYRLKGETQVMDHKLGWGDVVMFGVLGIWLPPFTFIFFYSGCMFLFTIIMLMAQISGRISRDFSIPLAGMLGLAFVIFFPCWQYFSLLQI